jgi:hypothetical protein
MSNSSSWQKAGQYNHISTVFSTNKQALCHYMQEGQHVQWYRKAVRAIVKLLLNGISFSYQFNDHHLTTNNNTFILKVQWICKNKQLGIS